MFPRAFLSFFTPRKAAQRKRPASRFPGLRLGFEILEDRTLPSTIVQNLLIDPDGAGSLPARDIGDVALVATGDDFTVTYQIHDISTGGPSALLSDYHLTNFDIKVDDNSDFLSPELTATGTINPEGKSFTTSFTLPAGMSASSGIYIRAGAGVVNLRTSLDNLTAALPSTVSIQVVHPGTLLTPPSYFDTIITDGGWLNGIYNGWCIDTNRTISEGITYHNVQVYSSYEPLPADGVNGESAGVENTQNLDLVNWIINQNFAGQAAYDNLGADAGNNGYGEALGTFTYGDVQRALWQLIESQPSTAGLGLWSPARVDEIIAAAVANGEKFVPGPDQTVAVILRPVNAAGVTSSQVGIAEVSLAEIPAAAAAGEAAADFLQFTAGSFTTHSRGGWGAPAQGNNAGQYLQTNFEAAIGSLTVATLGGARSYNLDTADQVQAFLRASQRNPYLGYVPSDLEKQVVALKLSVRFDAWDPDFSASTTQLGSLRLCDLTGALAALNGKSINQVLSAVDSYLQGTSTLGLAGAEWLYVMRSLNEAFAGGNAISDFAANNLCGP